MALTREQLAELKAPEGFTFHERPTLKVAGYLKVDDAHKWGTHAAVKAGLTRLVKWAHDNDLGIKMALHSDVRAKFGREQQGYTYVSHQYYDVNCPTWWKVVANTPKLTDETLGKWTCPCGHNVFDIGDVYCAQSCGLNTCASCQMSFIKLYKVFTQTGESRWYCSTCSRECEKKGCAGRTVGAGDACGVCDPRTICPICARYKPVSGCIKVEDEAAAARLRLRSERVIGGRRARGQVDDVFVCEPCAKTHYCNECKTHRWDEGTKGGVCVLCRDKATEAKRVVYEKFPKDWLPKDGNLLIPSSQTRSFRTISYEMEVEGDGELLARTLYRCGLVPIPRVGTYHQYPDTDATYPCFLKHDGSVSGGELIAYLLNLDDPKHAEAFLDMCRKVHSLVKLGKIQHTDQCGGHIHIDAHNFSYGDVWRLVTGFGYIEDVVYRISAAGSPGGHRTITNKRPRNGVGYAASPVKGPFGSKGVLGQSIKGQQRHHGLNFTPYLAAARNCECGAQAYEDSKNCKCNLGKATIEWRLFDSTHNPRILHAWIALVQALHAWSEGDEDPTADWEKQYPAMPWTCLPFDKTTKAHKDTAKQRLEWIFQYLPLTDGERDSLCYAIKESDMASLGSDFIDSLLDIRPQNEFPQKKPARNPARRQRAIKIEVPTPGSAEGKVRHDDGLIDIPFPEAGVPPAMPPLDVAADLRRAQERIRQQLRFVDDPAQG